MPTGAPLPVREFASATEMRAHYAAVHARLMGGTGLVAAKLRVEPPKPIVVEPIEAAALAAQELVEPGPERRRPDLWRDYVGRTHEAYGDAEVRSVQQREGRAEMTGVDVLRLVASVTSLKQGDLRSDSRLAPLVKARQIACWLLVVKAGKGLNEAGGLLGGKDHTTVLHGRRKVEAAMTALWIRPEEDAGEIARLLWAGKWPSLDRRRKYAVGEDRRCA